MRLDKCKMREFVQDLRSAYEQAIKDAGQFAPHTRKSILLERATNKPAKSFYVTYEEGLRMIRRIDKKGMSGVGKEYPLTAQKYNDLYRVYLKLKEQYQGEPEIVLARMAVDSPAPRFYIRPQTAGLILNKYISL